MINVKKALVVAKLINNFLRYRDKGEWELASNQDMKVSGA